MTILCPIDESDASFRALDFAVEMATREEKGLHVVHVTDIETEITRELIQRARDVLEEAGIENDPEVLTNYSTFRASSQVGEDIVKLLRRNDEYDHVVMGHHRTGKAGRLLLGSAAQKVLHADLVPVTIVPSGEE